MSDNKTKEELSYTAAYLEMVNAELEEKLRQTEEVLRTVTEQYRRITTAVSDYIFSVHVVGGEPVKTVHGPACTRITGYTPEEFAGNKYLWIVMVKEEDRPMVLKYVADILSGHEVKPIEHRILRKDGVMRWVRNIPVCQYDKEGHLVTYDGLIQDITDQKLANGVQENSGNGKNPILQEQTMDILNS